MKAGALRSVYPNQSAVEEEQAPGPTGAGWRQRHGTRVRHKLFTTRTLARPCSTQALHHTHARSLALNCDDSPVN